MGIFRRKKNTEISEDLAANLIYPRHIAIIMDGNGRGAKKRGLPRNLGHQKGAENVISTTEICADIEDIQQLTLYAFSTENWKRPEKEINYLFSLLKKFLIKERPSLIKNQVRFKAVGDIEAFPDDVQNEIQESTEVTKDFKRMTLALALNYGSRQEIVRATKRIAEKVKLGEIDIDEISEEIFSENLYQPDMPSVDLLIRTSGEMRISNYLLWQISYAELYITNVFWPDFKEEELFKAFKDFTNRDRRFGGLSNK